MSPAWRVLLPRVVGEDVLGKLRLGLSRATRLNHHLACANAEHLFSRGPEKQHLLQEQLCVAWSYAKPELAMSQLALHAQHEHVHGFVEVSPLPTASCSPPRTVSERVEHGALDPAAIRPVRAA